MKPNIGITEKHLQAVAEELQKLLADEFVLYTKTRNYHWNVMGSSFMELHKLYETQYEQLDEIMDSVAERIRQLGHFAEGQLKDFVRITRLGEDGYTSDHKVQLKNLLEDHETIARHIRQNIDDFSDKYKDAGSADFVTGIL
ncbi:MAG: DNA starvation/stationary phase protection protein, partial [Bacteroidetes bacterium]|nr:DNA starvation/stationary phase protection protein [Bacteroidota bacterium]